MKVLSEKFYARSPVTVARDLLGKVFVYGKCKGVIVETEAYLGENDPGAIGARKVKNIPKALLNPPGHSFVYFTYGNHWMFNVIAKTGQLGAVLIRAIEPIEGFDLMKKRRGADGVENLTNGPGKWTQAFGIDKSLNEVKLDKKDYCILHSNNKPEIVSDARIGLSKDFPENSKMRNLRFYIKGNPFVSKVKK